MSRILRHPDAFSLDRTRTRTEGKKDIRSQEHITFIKMLPCVITGLHGVEAAHINYADPTIGKTHRGKQTKHDDCFVLPLTPKMHREQHDFGDEKGWWQSKNIDPNKLALRLWQLSGNYEEAIAVINMVRKFARM